MQRLALAAALVAAPAALASHPDGPYRSLWANLDDDRALERIVGWQASDIDHDPIHWWVTIENACRGKKTEYRVSRKWAKLAALRVPQADAVTFRREVFYILRGPTGRGEAAVVRLNRRASCPAPYFLFRYVSRDGVARFSVRLEDLEPSSPGLEIRLSETMAGGASTVRFYAYSRRADRYVVYRTTTV